VYARQLMVSRPLTRTVVKPLAYQGADRWLILAGVSVLGMLHNPIDTFCSTVAVGGSPQLLPARIRRDHNPGQASPERGRGNQRISTPGATDCRDVRRAAVGADPLRAGWIREEVARHAAGGPPAKTERAALNPAAETAPSGSGIQGPAPVQCGHAYLNYDPAGMNSICEPPLAGPGGGVWMQV
jgi:hypothetical protein